MPAIIAAILQGLGYLFRNRLGTWLLSALAFFGIAWTTNNVVLQPSLDLLTSFAQGSGGNAGEYWAIARQWAGVLRFDVALSMVVSAFVTAVGISNAKLFFTKRS